MMRFLRNVFGCSIREQAYEEEAEREAAARLAAQREIERRVKAMQAAARNMEATARLMDKFKKEAEEW